MDKTTSTDLSDFGSRERALVEELLVAWREQGLPCDFYNDKVQPMMNMHSGYVFLANSDFQVAMLNGSKLESFYTCGNCGLEGFTEDLEEQVKEGYGCLECKQLYSYDT